MPPEKPQWTELYSEVVTGGLCTGCAGCIIACPHDVLDYNTTDGAYKPFHLDIDGSIDSCTHGEKGCTMCTRACPRFRMWETEIDEKRFGRERTDDEVFGQSLDIVLARATDPELAAAGQDGGFVSALLAFALENDHIDAALVSGLEGGGSWRAVPTMVRTEMRYGSTTWALSTGMSQASRSRFSSMNLVAGRSGRCPAMAVKRAEQTVTGPL